MVISFLNFVKTFVKYYKEPWHVIKFISKYDIYSHQMNILKDDQKFFLLDFGNILKEKFDIHNVEIEEENLKYQSSLLKFKSKDDLLKCEVFFLKGQVIYKYQDDQSLGTGYLSPSFFNILPLKKDKNI